MALPHCYRCRVRSLECQYHHVPLTGRQLDPEPISDPEISANTGDMYDTSLDGLLHQIEAHDTVISLEDAPTGTALPPFPDYDLDWQDIMENIQDYSVPDQIAVNDSPTRSVLAGEIYQERVIYAVKWLKCLPRLFVVQGQTAFIHKSLFSTQAPHAIQDALGACALYARKNEANQALVYRNLSQQVDRLGRNYADSSALEQLASVQAMTLLQIIRYFDGDIRQRADAERTEPLFLEWIRQLQHRLKTSESRREELVLSQTADSWKSWLFSESLRRTIIMGYTLQGFYSFLKNGWDDSHHEFNQLSFYAQRALWTAASAFQWESALEKHLAFPTRFAQWDADLASATPADMDDLGMIMMVLIKGVDACSRWAGEHFIESYESYDPIEK